MAPRRSTAPPTRAASAGFAGASGSCCGSSAAASELQQEWQWTERYATQPEILRYLDHVVDRFDLRRDIQLRTRVTAALFDEGADRWALGTGQGESVSARFLVLATGCLSVAKTPDIEGIERFQGERHHTSRWPQEGVDFTGKRVGVLGTGSTGVPYRKRCEEIAAQHCEGFALSRAG
ncbi:NAD(P)-binding domain-containing protein [Sorangium sp. So ce590]|uniref:NAD(P)-binding domain-containing protein n=1 Tax=Sorangium sp. So ce590 TaxID=3133317 RepID=UPI003F639FA9